MYVYGAQTDAIRVVNDGVRRIAVFTNRTAILFTYIIVCIERD